MSMPEGLVIKTTDESGVSSNPARIEIFWQGKLVKVIHANTERKKGGDGGLYNCVVFKDFPVP